jgi:Mn-dependent DtxR family transcriptional regulator
MPLDNGSKVDLRDETTEDLCIQVYDLVQNEAVVQFVRTKRELENRRRSITQALNEINRAVIG